MSDDDRTEQIPVPPGTEPDATDASEQTGGDLAGTQRIETGKPRLSRTTVPRSASPARTSVPRGPGPTTTAPTTEDEMDTDRVAAQATTPETGSTTPRWSAPQGSVPQGSVPQGSAPHGSAPHGSAPGGPEAPRDTPPTPGTGSAGAPGPVVWSTATSGARGVRVGTVVWGLVIAAIGVGLLAFASGVVFDVELALIGLVAAAGVALLAGSLVTGMRRRGR